MSKPFAEIITDENKRQKFLDIYENEEEALYAIRGIQQINKDLEKREQASIVTNGIPYSKAYEYNIKKSINYSAPRNSEDDREVSMGLVHEKVVAFVALFLKYAFKRRIKCYSNDMQLIDGMGTFYDLAIEFSLKEEKFIKKIALIIWEVFVQGNAFVYEDWEVKNIVEKRAFDKDGNDVTDKMDYTFEYLDTLTFKDGEAKQTRKAVSRRLDGRNVIFGNPEIEEVQDQPRVTLEHKYTKSDAEAMFGSLTRWSKVPTSREDINTITAETLTLFNISRIKDPKDEYLVHYTFDKENNRYNIYCNGILLLKSSTPMSIFYPRMNYPLSNVPCERLAGFIYARSTPAKTKFNADYLDWAFKMMAMRFEQGMTPAILVKSGKYTLSKKIFKAGQVTHGVSKEDYERADPENKGLTQSEFSFVEMLKQIVETQTLSASATGEISPNATATEINQVQSAQMEKLGFLLDGLMGGFMDMYLRRAETIESKYTIKQKETIVDGKTVGVYQNFSIGMGSVNHNVMFDEEVGSPTYDVKGKRAELFKKAFDSKKEGKPNEFHLVNPKEIRERNHIVDIEIIPERIKDTALQVQQLLAEFQAIKGVFNNIDDKELEKEYLEVSGRPDSLFLPAELMQQNQQMMQDPNAEQPSNFRSNKVPQQKLGNTPSLMNKVTR